jgi:hypothetical protein
MDKDKRQLLGQSPSPDSVSNAIDSKQTKDEHIEEESRTDEERERALAAAYKLILAQQRKK